MATEQVMQSNKDRWSSIINQSTATMPQLHWPSNREPGPYGYDLFPTRKPGSSCLQAEHQPWESVHAQVFLLNKNQGA